jgi:hypothetical protein
MLSAEIFFPHQSARFSIISIFLGRVFCNQGIPVNPKIAPAKATGKIFSLHQFALIQHHFDFFRPGFLQPMYSGTSKNCPGRCYLQKYFPYINLH